MGEWISVDDRLPDDSQDILLVVNGARVISGYYAGYNGAHYVWKASRNGFVFWDDEITHWMPLPELPKEEESC